MTTTNVPLLKQTRAWLANLQRQDYTLSTFKKENGDLGVAWDMPFLEILQKMMWGDKMCCFYRTSGIKSPLWFAVWPITKLMGLTKEALSHIADNCRSTPVDLGGLMVHRAYGSYTTGLTFKIDVSLARVATLLSGFVATGGEIGYPRIGCGRGVLKYLGTPFPSFPDIPYDPEEIRPFNLAAASADFKQSKGKKRTAVKGFYPMENMDDPEYPWPLNPCPEIPASNYIEELEGGVGCGLVQSMLNYLSATERVEHLAF